MITQEEKGQDGAASWQYVMSYDSVPGGTGYLHELLANDAKTLIDAVRLALSQLAACSCNMDPDKDGCIDVSTSTALAERWPLCPETAPDPSWSISQEVFIRWSESHRLRISTSNQI
jgi:hypothetical protein